MATSDTGVWIDDASGKVVFKRPRGSGTQLVQPGGEISNAAVIRADELGATIPGADKPTRQRSLAVETADEPSGDVEKAVTTDTAKPATKRAAARKKA